MHGDPAASGHRIVRRPRIGGDPGPLFDNYYGLINLEFWLRKYLGEDIARFIQRHVHPLDIVFRLARDHGIVLLDGGGFHAPDWSVRVRSRTWTTMSMTTLAARSEPSRRNAAYRAAQQAGSTREAPETAWPQEAMQ